MKNIKSSIAIISLLLVATLLLVYTQYQSQSTTELKFPPNILKAAEQNKEALSDFAVKVSFFIAFIAGMLSLLSPCILPFIPAYFTYTFKEKTNITRMTLIFFLGFSSVFVTLGIVAGFIGEQSTHAIQHPIAITIAGIIMIGLGLITLKGKDVCHYIDIKTKFKNDVPGTFLFGMAFAMGWTACLGPILGGILGMGAILGSIANAALLMFFYSLGNLVPLFLLSMLYDKYNLGESKLIKGKLFTFKILNKDYTVHSTNLVSGVLFILIGLVMIIFKGTAVVNSLDIFGTKEYFYLLQRLLIEWQYAGILGIITFILFAALLIIFLKRKKK